MRADGSMVDEIETKSRSSSMLGVFRGMRKAVFGNEVMESDVRVSLAQSLLHSRLLYNAATWQYCSPS